MFRWLKNRIKTIYQQFVLPAPQQHTLTEATKFPSPGIPAEPFDLQAELAQRKLPSGPWGEDYCAWSKTAQLLLSPQAPGHFTHKHSLTLSMLRMRSLPARLKVKGNLQLRQCQRLRTIGDFLEVEGDLEIGGRCTQTWWSQNAVRDPACSFAHQLSKDSQCPLESLPNGLVVYKSCHLTSCYNLVSLPEEFKLGGGLTIEGCRQFRALPKFFTVYGDLNLIDCPQLRELPAGNLVVHGNARLIGLPIESLPRNLHVHGNLTIESCAKFISLPSGLRVGGKLTLRNCPIREFPVRLEIGGDLVIEACPQLNVIPDSLKLPAGLRIRRCQALTTIEPGLKVGKSLSIIECQGIKELPDGLKIPHHLNLTGCRSLEMLGLETTIGLGSAKPRFDQAVLILSDCQALEWLPSDLNVRGSIDIAGSGITDMPEIMAAQYRLMWRGRSVRPDVVFHPERLSVSNVLDERNAELRRLMLERIGIDNFLAKAQMTMLDEDTDAGGRRALIEVLVSERYRRYLWCRCPSTERQYLLRVPGNLPTARHAAAWLAGFDNPDRYRPVLET